MPGSVPISPAAFALLGAGLVLRLLAFFTLVQFGTPLFSDMRYYAELGEKIFQGHMLDSYERYFIPLGPSYLYASMKLLGARATLTMPLFNIGIDLLSCLLIGRLAAVLVSPSLQTWALGIACLYPPFILQSSFILNETPFHFLALSAYYWYVCAVVQRQRPGVYGWLFGLAFVLAIQFKTNLWLLLPLLLLASLRWPAMRCPPSFVVAALLSILLLSIPARLATNASALGSLANASMSLYLGRTYASSLVTFDSEKSQWLYNTPPGLFYKHKHEPIVINRSPLDTQFFLEATARYVWEHKATLVTYSLEHVLDLFGLVPYWPLVQTELAFLDLPLRLVLVPVVFLPALFGIFFVPDRRNRILLTLPLITIVMVSGIFHGAPRYRLPYDGYILILAMVCYSRLYYRSRHA